LPEGVYALTAYANDAVGKSANVTHTLYVDNMAPTVSINAPLAHGATVSALPATISGTVNDNLGISNVSLVRWRLRGTIGGVFKYWSSSTGTWTTSSSTLNGTSPTRPSADTNWTSTGSLPQGANLPNGTYSLTAYVNDKAGRSSNITHTFTVNNSLTLGSSQVSSTPSTASVVVLSSATASAATQQLRLNFSGDLNAQVAEDATHYTILVGGIQVEVESAQYSAARRSVVLNLRQSTLGRGDKIVVRWTELCDAQGHEVKAQELALIAG
jgi:hypothetical protein